MFKLNCLVGDCIKEVSVVADDEHCSAAFYGSFINREHSFKRTGNSKKKHADSTGFAKGILMSFGKGFSEKRS